MGSAPGVTGTSSSAALGDDSVFDSIFDRSEVTGNASNHSSLVRLTWSELCVSVRTRRGQEKVLQGQCGALDRGEVLFVYGSSGSGKSTLLKALSDRRPGRVSGVIALNGIPLSHVNAGQLAKLIEQLPVFEPSLTARQTLHFADRFHRGDFGREAEVRRRARVQRMLEVIEMAQEADYVLSSKWFKRQRLLRLAIGVELLGCPHFLLLDDPTLFMDAHSAILLMKEIVRIARRTNITLMCALNTGSSEIFNLSDKTLLLSQGKMVYFGETDSLAGYLSFLGPEFALPEDAVMSEFIHHAISPLFGNAERAQKLQTKWLGSPNLAELLKDAHVVIRADPGMNAGVRRRATSSPILQFWWLVKRKLLSTAQRPGADTVRIMAYLALALMIGAVWIQQRPDPFQAYDAATALFLLSVALPLPSSFIIMRSDLEKAIRWRELQNFHYSVAVYWATQLLVNAVVAILVALTAGPILYYTLELTSEAHRVLIFLLAMALYIFAIDSVAELIITVAPERISAYMGGLFAFSWGVLTQGFMLFRRQMGDAVRWMVDISIAWYFFGPVFVNHYRDRPPLGDLGVLPPFSGNQLIAVFGYDDVRIWRSLTIMLGISLACRLVSLAVLTLKVSRKQTQ